MEDFSFSPQYSAKEKASWILVHSSEQRHAFWEWSIHAHLTCQRESHLFFDLTGVLIFLKIRFSFCFMKTATANYFHELIITQQTGEKSQERQCSLSDKTCSYLKYQENESMLLTVGA